MPGTIVAGALGNCVHVAGAAGFLSIAERLGYKTVFLGAAVPVDAFADAIERDKPEIVGVGYRLTPEVGAKLLEELRRSLEARGLMDTRFVFGGTPPMCEVARGLGWFDRCFDGLENPDEVWAYLRGETPATESESLDGSLLERLARKHPYPLLRHHFGLPSLEDTVEGVRKIADSGVLDVISVAPDQNAQESFFRPEEMDPTLDGAGGAPVRSADDLSAIYRASRCGNYPLLRIYSGTRDLIAWAEVASKTIANAWAAIPLCSSRNPGGGQRGPSLGPARFARCDFGRDGLPGRIQCQEDGREPLRGAVHVQHAGRDLARDGPGEDPGSGRDRGESARAGVHLAAAGPGRPSAPVTTPRQG